MKYKEETRDLFSVPENYYLAHCVSADFALGAGIAVEFNRRFNMREKLRNEGLQNLWGQMQAYGLQGECILIDRVFNLVTKEKYYHKPTYASMTDALICMKILCRLNGIYKVAMPLIGCGLDRLQWSKVSQIIKDVFENTGIEILVCRQ